MLFRSAISSSTEYQISVARKYVSTSFWFANSFFDNSYDSFTLPSMALIIYFEEVSLTWYILPFFSISITQSPCTLKITNILTFFIRSLSPLYFLFSYRVCQDSTYNLIDHLPAWRYCSNVVISRRGVAQRRGQTKNIHWKTDFKIVYMFLKLWGEIRRKNIHWKADSEIMSIKIEIRLWFHSSNAKNIYTISGWSHPCLFHIEIFDFYRKIHIHDF